MKVCRICSHGEGEAKFASGARTCNSCVYKKRIEKMKEWRRKDRIKNPDKDKVYYELNKERIKKVHSKYREENKEKMKSLQARWRKTERGKSSRIETQKSFIKKHPEKIQAYMIVSNARRMGSLADEESCQYPNCIYTTKVEAHHPDYTKPLQVVWLCKAHHMIADKVRRAKELYKI